MKQFRKLLLLGFLLLALTTFVNAQQQNKLRIAGGVSLVSGDVHQHFELGSTNGINTWALSTETFDQDDDNRQWYTGVKYLHQTQIGGTADFVLGGEALIHMNKDKDMIFKPIAGVQLNLGQKVGILGTMSVPIADNSSPFNPITLQGGLGLVLRL